MFLNFEMQKEERYSILDKYYVSNGDQQGVFYLLADKRNRIKEVFLPKDEMNGEFLPKKTKDKKFKYKAMGIKMGEKEEVIVHIGEWTMKGWMDKKKKVPDKIYYFIYEKTTH